MLCSDVPNIFEARAPPAFAEDDDMIGTVYSMTKSEVSKEQY